VKGRDENIPLERPELLKGHPTSRPQAFHLRSVRMERSSNGICPDNRVPDF
jgi:hypothetical protein